MNPIGNAACRNGTALRNARRTKTKGESTMRPDSTSKNHTVSYFKLYYNINHTLIQAGIHLQVLDYSVLMALWFQSEKESNRPFFGLVSVLTLNHTIHHACGTNQRCCSNLKDLGSSVTPSLYSVTFASKMATLKISLNTGKFII